MPIIPEGKTKKASPFEIEIYAEMHNLINIADEFKATKANIIILTKLISVVKNLDAEQAMIYVNMMKKITAPNLTVRQTTVLRGVGWELVDRLEGLTIPATPEIYNAAVKLFLQLQHRKINTALSALMVDVLQFLMTKDMFVYDSEREGDMYANLVTGSTFGGRMDE